MERRPNPFAISGPAMVSFSGGRTSGYMLFKIVEAHGGALPDDVHVNFANTGKERDETLRFVHECATRFGVKINWLEYRPDAPGFELVGFNSASRKGEPFQALLDKKKRLPNWKQRWCTSLLKVQPMTDFAKSMGLTPGEYTEVVGLRYDEGLRIFKGMENAEKRGRKMAYPLSNARTIKADVMRFWLGANTDPKNLKHPLPQGFDLGLRDYEGNCDLCFLKGRGIKKRIIAENPELATWWANNETDKGTGVAGWFDRRDRIAGLIAEVRRMPDLFEDPDFEEYDAECGLHCGAHNVDDLQTDAAE